jgi:hypothetical protein
MHEAVLPGLLVRVVVYMAHQTYLAILEGALSSAISFPNTGEQKKNKICLRVIAHLRPYA